MKRIKVIVSCVLLLTMFVTLCLGAAAEEKKILTATERVKNLANEEGNWRYGAATVKMIGGLIFIASGASIFSAGRDNIFVMIVTIPMGVAIALPGFVFLGWGSLDLLFGSREYENAYGGIEKLTLASQEDASLTYLRTRAEREKGDRTPSFWNGFGFFSQWELPAEKSYKEYLKDRTL